jgi:hypothetical protein
MSCTVAELFQSSCDRRRTGQATPARSDHTNIGALGATLVEPGVGPCAERTTRTKVKLRIPRSVVGPRHTMSPVGSRFEVSDPYDYEDREITDEEFQELLEADRVAGTGVCPLTP